VLSKNSTIRVQTVDAVRRRVFVASMGVQFTLDAGAFDIVEISPSAGTVKLTILPAPGGNTAAAVAPAARLVVRQTAKLPGVGNIKLQDSSIKMDAGAYTIPFSSGSTTVTFSTK